ncbi:oxygen-independent coproporphyrinogen III oxidase [Alphaproteobacteria bacterium]|nr:oxygen-independent coproporphyrinogen III oxidase [Alphaproteobacteria bacterium]
MTVILTNEERELIAEYGQGSVPRYTSYPTAPNFQDGFNPFTKEQWLSNLDLSEPVSLYLHIPFCREICWYCGCNTKATQSDKPIEAYVKWLIQEIEQTGALLPGRLTASHIHWGGGTPNLLSTGDFNVMLQTVHNHFDFDPESEHAIEIDPRNCSDDLINALPSLGINRVSLGIQDFDLKVQKAINRVQSYQLVKSCVERLRAAGIKNINFDLILGLPFQTLESFDKTIELSKSLNPSRLAVFGYAHLPQRLPHQRLIPTEKLPDSEERFLLNKLAQRRLVELGFVEIGLDHYALPDDSMAAQLNSRELSRNVQGYTTDKATSLLGFGVSAISQFKEGYCQNWSTTKDYYSIVSKGGLPVKRGLALDEEDHIRAEIIQQIMCLKRLDLSTLPGGVDAALPTWLSCLERLKRLESAGLLTLGIEELTVTDLGRIFLRVIANTFDAYSKDNLTRHASTL